MKIDKLKEIFEDESLKYALATNLAKYGRPQSKKSDKKRGNGKNLAGFSINIGRKHRATPIDIISIINRALKSNDIEIGKIELNRYQTFFEIDKDFSDQLKSNIKKIDFRGNEIVLGNPADFDGIAPRRRNEKRKSRGRISSRKKSKKKKKSRFK